MNVERKSSYWLCLAGALSTIAMFSACSQDNISHEPGAAAQNAQPENGLRVALSDYNLGTAANVCVGCISDTTQCKSDNQSTQIARFVWNYDRTALPRETTNAALRQWLQSEISRRLQAHNEQKEPEDLSVSTCGQMQCSLNEKAGNNPCDDGLVTQADRLQTSQQKKDQARKQAGEVFMEGNQQWCLRGLACVHSDGQVICDGHSRILDASSELNAMNVLCRVTVDGQKASPSCRWVKPGETQADGMEATCAKAATVQETATGRVAP